MLRPTTRAGRPREAPAQPRYTGKYDHGSWATTRAWTRSRPRCCGSSWPARGRARPAPQQADIYHERLIGTPLFVPPEAEGFRHCFYMFHVRAPRRDELMAFLQEREISTARTTSPGAPPAGAGPYGLDQVSLP